MEHLTFEQIKELLTLVLDKALALATLWFGYKAGHRVGRNGSARNGDKS